MEGTNSRILAIELEIEGIKLEIEGSKQEIRDLTTQESNKTLSEEMQLEMLRSKTAKESIIAAKESIIAAKESKIVALIYEKIEVMKVSAGVTQRILSIHLCFFHLLRILDDRPATPGNYKQIILCCVGKLNVTIC